MTRRSTRFPPRKHCRALGVVVSADTQEQPTEEQRVVAHRCRQLVLAGFPPAEAWQLAESTADWRDAARLLEQGASPDQVVRILT